MNDSSIKAVTFDVGGPLITPLQSVGHVYAEVAAKHGVKIAPAILNHQFARAWKRRIEFNHSRGEWAGIVDDTFQGLTSVVPSQVFFDEVFDRFAEPEVWRIYPDVIPVLDELAARGVILAVISNWDERLRPLLTKLGLAPYFENMIISCEVGFSKPSPVPFELASRKLGVPPGEILHVGDSMDHDGIGAERAGFQWRLIERDKPNPEGKWIATLEELESLV